jgi:hypothetical protein
MRGHVLVDLRNIYHPGDAVAEGFLFKSIGRPNPPFGER